MVLPYADNLKIEYLSHIFDRNRISNCYKYFWFLSILEKISETNTDFSYDELITEMVVNAWYMVNEYRLKLGPTNTTDNLEEVVKYLHDEVFGGRVSSTVKKEALRGLLNSLEDDKYKQYKNTLTNNVPYCLQSPFYGNYLKDPNKNRIEEINRERRLIYYFKEYKKLDTIISITDEWAGYLIRNREILTDWTRYNLIGYLQSRNPSVPGIADKIIPPYARNLNRVKKYWSVVIEADNSIRDIYGDNLLSDVSISIDHFIPWQYVAHDELWNLNPTTKNINSSKGNNLPNWDKYFCRLLELEYKAYTLQFENKRVAEAFKTCADYHLNNAEIRNSLYAENLDINDFGTRLENVIKPVYESAVNCGFREW